MDRYKGYVTWFEDSTGTGWVKMERHGGVYVDVYIHFSELRKEGVKTLDEGDYVEFGVEVGKNGIRMATDITVVADDEN